MIESDGGEDGGIKWPVNMGFSDASESDIEGVERAERSCHNNRCAFSDFRPKDFVDNFQMGCVWFARFKSRVIGGRVRVRSQTRANGSRVGQRAI